MPNESHMQEKMIECVIPILRVTNMAQSQDYYENRLGFKLEWSQGNMASVSRDRFSIYLCEGDQGQLGTWLWIGVEDIDTLYAEFIQNGAVITQTPTNYSWACEMRIADLDNHILRFGGESKADQPIND